MTAAPISATGRVSAPPDVVFRRLCDLDAHHDLAAPHIEVLGLRGPRGARTGGAVALRGPLGVRLRARTRVRTAEFPRELSGTAEADGGTIAALAWHLEPDGARTELTVRLTVRPARAWHRLLLAFGGRLWLRRRLATAIERLAAASQTVPA